MTEKSYQEARKIMQKANYWRGMITSAKGNVAKWTNIESSYREKMDPGKADGANKMLHKAMNRLAEVRQKFTDIKFPDNEPAVLPKTGK
jgi:hypothetical protein